MSARRRLQPVTRQPHWRLKCACGTLLAECACDATTKYTEIWRDGCAWVARWQCGSPLVDEAPLYDEAQPIIRGKLAPHRATICADALTGVPLVVLAQRYGVTSSAISHVLRQGGVPRYLVRRRRSA